MGMRSKGPFAINVDLETANNPDRNPTRCGVHPDAGRHYDITIHDGACRRSTQRARRYWLSGFQTLGSAQGRAQEEAAKWTPQVNLRVLVREANCIR